MDHLVDLNCGNSSFHNETKQLPRASCISFSNVLSARASAMKNESRCRHCTHRRDSALFSGYKPPTWADIASCSEELSSFGLAFTG